jgi:flagellar biosynthesis/type III secretory pathway protein FliH
MSTLPSALHRFVPTLTEVVSPSSLAPSVNDGLMAEEALIKSLTQQLSAVIERRMADSVAELTQKIVAEHLNNMSQILKLELEAAVRQTLHQAQSLNLNQYKQK